MQVLSSLVNMEGGRILCSFEKEERVVARVELVNLLLMEEIDWR